MMTFTILLAIAAAVIMFQLWESNKSQAKPIRIESRIDQREQQRRRRGR